MKIINLKLASLLLFSMSLSSTLLFADGDPQLSTAIGSSKFDAKSGKEIYESSCIACHMKNGQGAKGAGMYPALANNPFLMSSEMTLAVVTKGLRGMPPLREYLTDEQIVEVVKYVRTNFGNNYTSPVLVKDIPK